MAHRASLHSPRRHQRLGRYTWGRSPHHVDATKQRCERTSRVINRSLSKAQATSGATERGVSHAGRKWEGTISSRRWPVRAIGSRYGKPTPERAVSLRWMRHHVAPVAGRVADRQEDRHVAAPSLGEGLVTPREPVDGVVGVLEQIRRGGVGEPVGHRKGRLESGARRRYRRRQHHPSGCCERPDRCCERPSRPCVHQGRSCARRNGTTAAGTAATTQ